MVAIKDLEEILSTVIGRSVELDEASSVRTVDGWDSLNNIHFIYNIEEKYHIRFQIGEIEMVPDVGELLYLINAKIQE